MFYAPKSVVQQMGKSKSYMSTLKLPSLYDHRHVVSESFHITPFSTIIDTIRFRSICIVEKYTVSVCRQLKQEINVKETFCKKELLDTGLNHMAGNPPSTGLYMYHT